MSEEFFDPPRALRLHGSFVLCYSRLRGAALDIASLGRPFRPLPLTLEWLAASLLFFNLVLLFRIGGGVQSTHR